MTEHTLFILFYSLSALVCFLVTTGLLFLKPLRSVRNRKYRNACRFLALASAFVGSSSLLTILIGRGALAELGLLAFPVLLVASSQSLLFTFLLILLFREEYVTRRNILLHASPSFVLTLLYLAALCFYDDPAVYTFSQWREQINNPTLLIRSVYTLVYMVQLIIYTRIFFRERTIYGKNLDSLAKVPERLELRWITRVFLYALTIGLLALSLCFYLSVAYEMALTALFALFYLTTGAYYVNYHFTYDLMREELFKANALPLPEEKAGNEKAGLGTLVGELAQAQEEKLFEEAEKLMNAAPPPYIDPDFNRSALVRKLHTNEHYLTRAIRRGRTPEFNIQTYITNYRIDYAATLLVNPYSNCSIEQIATDSGFSSVRTFNRCFKEKVGESPSEFRKKRPSEMG